MIVMATSTFVAVVNVAGLTRMLHCFVGCAELAAPANATETIAVMKTIQLRKRFMGSSLLFNFVAFIGGRHDHRRRERLA